jgi:cytochrome P450
MALHPEVQKRVQEEIDRVVPNWRLPTVEDIKDLPYLAAVIKETMRWKPILPFSEYSALDACRDDLIPCVYRYSSSSKEGRRL